MDTHRPCGLVSDTYAFLAAQFLDQVGLYVSSGGKHSPLPQIIWLCFPRITPFLGRGVGGEEGIKPLLCLGTSDWEGLEHLTAGAILKVLKD